MKVLVVDMTHGGTIIASEFSKLPGFEVFALDIYKTLKEEDLKRLMKNGVKLVEEDFLEELMESNERSGGKSGRNEQFSRNEQSGRNGNVDKTDLDKIDLTEVLTVVKLTWIKSI